MPEYEHDLPSSEDPEWTRLVQDVEKRFEVMSDALANLRGAVIRLSSYRPQPQVIREYAPAPAAETSETSEAVTALEDAVRAFEAAATVSEASYVEPEPVVPESNGASPDNGSQAPSADDDAARREEVSRIVAEARGQQASAAPAFDGSWANASENDEVDSTSEGSWPMARHPGLPINPPPHRSIETESIADLAAEIGDAGSDTDPEEAARREEVARMVAEMRAGLGTEDAGALDEPADELGQDADVASLAARPVAEDEAVEADPEDEDVRRESVAETVARMRAEMAAGGSLDDEAAGDESGAVASDADDADVRDEVRKAVEAARAEMASGWGKDSDRPAGGAEKKFSFPDWQTTHVEPSGPPVIVIKDPEGRVELARVYETLSQVNCDENAALLNYTPHSVTVGLNTRAQVPSKEDMERAVEAVFGRRCRVESDGVRVSVDIGADKEDAA